MKLKYLIFLIACGSIFISTESAYAAKGGIKGPALKAYENASDNASFKRGKGNTELKKLDKDIDKDKDKDREHDDKEDKDNGKKDKDAQLDKSLNKEFKKAVRKTIK